MTTRTHDLWPTIDNVADWISRNCTTCRYRTRPHPNNHTLPTCPIPAIVIRAWKDNAPLSLPTALIIFGHHYNAAPHLHTLANYRCSTRKDNRGRPTAAERYLHG